MNPSTPSVDTRVGLAYVGLTHSVVSVLELLVFARLRATFFVSPAALVSDPARWRRVVNEGHELGNGALLDVTDDGRLPNWSLSAIAGDLHDADRLLNELGMSRVDSVYLPGRFHVCAEGSYLGLVQDGYAVCLSDLSKSSSVHGRGGAFEVRDLAFSGPFRKPCVVEVRGDPELTDHAQSLVRLADAAAGPLRMLADIGVTPA